MYQKLSELRTKEKRLAKECRELQTRIKQAKDSRTQTALLNKLCQAKKDLNAIRATLNEAADEASSKKNGNRAEQMSIPSAISYFRNEVLSSVRWLDSNPGLKGTRKYSDKLSEHKAASSELKFLRDHCGSGRIEFYRGPASAPKTIKRRATRP